jgi:hypothetical protein
MSYGEILTMSYREILTVEREDFYRELRWRSGKF